MSKVRVVSSYGGMMMVYERVENWIIQTACMHRGVQEGTLGDTIQELGIEKWKLPEKKGSFGLKRSESRQRSDTRSIENSIFGVRFFRRPINALSQLAS